MPRRYRKLCLDCDREFNNEGTKGCPSCAGDRWNFVNDQGVVVIPFDMIRRELPQYRRTVARRLEADLASEG